MPSFYSQKTEGSETECLFSASYFWKQCSVRQVIYGHLVDISRQRLDVSKASSGCPLAHEKGSGEILMPSLANVSDLPVSDA